MLMSEVVNCLSNYVGRDVTYNEVEIDSIQMYSQFEKNSNKYSAQSSSVSNVTESRNTDSGRISRSYERGRRRTVSYIKEGIHKKEKKENSMQRRVRNYGKSILSNNRKIDDIY